VNVKLVLVCASTVFCNVVGTAAVSGGVHRLWHGAPAFTGVMQ